MRVRPYCFLDHSLALLQFLDRCDDDDDRPYVYALFFQFSELLFNKSGHGRIGSEYSVYLADGDGGVPYHLAQWDGMLSKHGHRTYLEGGIGGSIIISFVHAPARHRRL
jgi:hypothetical protein